MPRTGGWAAAGTPAFFPAQGSGRNPVHVDCPAVDRRLANKNLRTALIAGAVALFVFAASWLAALVY